MVALPLYGSAQQLSCLRALARVLTGVTLLAGVALSAPPAAGQALAPMPTGLQQLVDEALQRNPDIRAAQQERLAARNRIAPAGALDEPMLEAGLLNVPTGSWSLRAEEMTMKMLGLSQRLPYPGKRQLRRDVASFDAEVFTYGLQETRNRIRRDVQVAYYDLALVDASTRIVLANRGVLEQFLRTAEARYAAGQATQADVLKAQTQLGRMLNELLRLERERPTAESELGRAVGKYLSVPLRAELPPVSAPNWQPEQIYEQALTSRPQLRGLEAAIARADKMIELARKDYYPDFDVKLSYGQRDPAPDGMRRDDMVSLTVAINLPVWRESRLDPRVAETIAMRDQSRQVYQAQLNELRMRVLQQTAAVEQGMKSVALYDSAILPQARLAVEAAFAAYRVNRIEILSLLDSQMTVFDYELSRAQAQATFAKALAEIDFLTGKTTEVQQ
jgi:cobalt-zinc-cadmium efflux system outer membrane protein